MPHLELAVVCGALGAGAAGFGGPSARFCATPGRVCREHANCCSGSCGPKDWTGRRTCRCQTVEDCLGIGPCRQATCTAGICGEIVTNNVPCQHPSACLGTGIFQNGSRTGAAPLAGQGERGGAHDLCCASGRSCAGDDEDPECWPKASDVCYRFGCCPAGDLCPGSDGSSRCCDEGTTCTRTGVCYASETSRDTQCCANAHATRTQSNFRCESRKNCGLNCCAGANDTCCGLGASG